MGSLVLGWAAILLGGIVWTVAFGPKQPRGRTKPFLLGIGLFLFGAVMLDAGHTASGAAAVPILFGGALLGVVARIAAWLTPKLRRTSEPFLEPRQPRVARSIPLLLRYHDIAGDPTERAVDVKSAEGVRVGDAVTVTLFTGFCHLRQELRTFRADRVDGAFDPATGEEIRNLAARLLPVMHILAREQGPATRTRKPRKVRVAH